MALFETASLFGGSENPYDKALKTRLDRLSTFANEEGVLKKGLVPTGLKTAFAKLVDVISRPNYAVAGAVDVLLGHGQAGETVGGRVWRELFGKGDKERFGEVLKQAGVGEGTKLSDIIGTNWVTKRWDPSARGTVALAMDVFLDPLTYLGISGGKYVAIGVGGAEKLSKAGMELVHVRGMRALLKDSARFGIISADDIAPLLKAGKTAAGESLEVVERKTVERAVMDSNLKGMVDRLAADNAASIARLAQPIRQQYFRRGEAQVIAGLKRGVLDRATFTAPTALRFAGVPIVEASKLTAPARKAAGFLEGLLSKSEPGAEIVEGVRKIGGAFNDLFSRVPWAAKKHRAYVALEEEHFVLKNQSDALSKSIVRDNVFGKDLYKVFMKKRTPATGKALMLAADNPSKYMPQWIEEAAKIGIDEEAATRILARWKSLAEGMFEAERSIGLQTRAAVADYMPHMLKEPLTKLEEQRIRSMRDLYPALRSSTRFRGEDVGRFAKRRSFKTFDQLQEAAKQVGVDVEKKINWDPIEVMHYRVRSHYEAMIDYQFGRDVLGLYAVGGSRPLPFRANAVLQQTKEEFFSDQGVLSKLTSKQIDQIDEAVKALKAGKRGKELKATLKGMSNAQKAATYFEWLPNIRSLADLADAEDVFKSMGKLPSKYQQALSKLRKKASAWGATGKVTRKNYEIVEIEKGSYAGKWVVPKGVAEGLLKEKGVWLENPEVNAFVKLVDRLTNWFKMAVTVPFPAFHVRNAYSNVFASAVDIRFAAFNPAWHKKAIDLLTGKDFTLKVAPGRYITAQELRGELEALGIKQERWVVAELTGARRALTKTERANFIKKAATAGASGGRFIENEARALHYLVLRGRGLSPAEAAHRVNQFLFDYNNLSPFEKNVMRRLVPFFTWTSKNIKRQALNLIERPGEIAAQIKAFDMGPGVDSLPEYMRGKMGIALISKPGKAGSYITGLDLPISNIDVLWRGGLGETVRGSLSMMNPLLKAPLEYAMNMDTFTGRSIKGQQWIGRMGPVLDRRLPKALKDYFQLQKHPNGKYTANGTRIYLAVKAMIWSRLASTAIRADELTQDPKSAAQWWSLLSGLNFNEFDINEAERQEVRNKVARLEKYLLEHGLAQEFKAISVPGKKKQSGLFSTAGLF